ncbi:hypothetical protein FA10DRAFT_268834 [Acaromyces ingoldii]|uniref:BHLH domain-containing protein n=1 Tax=Acaromyces ingoldii TaxID=215250 RepID=A0A316YHJ4_9BASI|nr:hypothetical protein FA10DRAFT_268834 [Acaromyces ingoldii]PWN88669.1 hypothetical protein FA10DRAFT_268834 [Acaromyces ingoldii]
MPGPYEDFDFTLDLPENITSSDLNLIASPGFGDLFGGGLSSGSHAPIGSSSSSSSMMFSPSLPSSSMSWSNSSQTTPRQSSTMDRGDALGLGLSGSQLTAVPSESSGQPMSGPPPPPFSPPAGGSLFSFDDIMAQPQIQHREPPEKQFQTHSQPHQHHSQPNHYPQHQDLGSLFNANESNFLTSFLSSFDGFDFNPTLPADMPSFANALEKGAASLTSAETAMARHRRRNGPPSNSAASPTKSTGSGATPTAGAAFGQALEGLSDDDEGADDVLSASRRKRGNNAASAMDVFPHLRQQQQHQQQQLQQHPQHYHHQHHFDNGIYGIYPGSANNNQGFDVSLATIGNGKKMKTEHGVSSTLSSPDTISQHHRRPSSNPISQASPQHSSSAATAAAAAAAAAAAKKDLLSEGEKRQNHILSEQRRRNHIREAFKELVDLLEAGREFGARGLGLSSGAGTGIEDEGLDDRSDYESTLEDEEASAASKRRKAKAKRATAAAAAAQAQASAISTQVGSSAAAAARGSASTRGRGKGRGRGGSAGGGAGSKSAVLFQAVDLLVWLQGKNEHLERHVSLLEQAAANAGTAQDGRTTPLIQ